MNTLATIVAYSILAVVAAPFILPWFLPGIWVIRGFYRLIRSSF